MEELEILIQENQPVDWTPSVGTGKGLPRASREAAAWLWMSISPCPVLCLMSVKMLLPSLFFCGKSWKASE